MLSSHNILNPANGAPITVPSQDMVLGLYYLTKGRKGQLGEGKKFYSAEEVIIAYNEGKLSKHALIKVRVNTRDKKTGNLETKMVETVTGRVIFNQVVPS
jgi:DNA-directed RNA polymerase subunit beta'